MASSKQAPPKSIASGAKLLFAALLALRDAGGELPGREVVARVGESVELSDWEKERFEKSGYIRWQSLLHFFSIDAIKAGFMRKKKGIWSLTPEGAKAIDLGARGLLDKAREEYRRWRRENPKSEEVVGGFEAQSSDGERKSAAVTLSEVEQDALDGFRRFVDAKNAYEFQDLVAALMRGMGYHVPLVAAPGKDGGIDVVAYQDPLGTKAPRLRIQVKHRPATPAPVHEIRQLMGLLSDGDVGIFVSSGGFTADAKSGIRNAKVHVELIDFERFMGLWQDYYSRMSDEDKNLLPMQPIFFLAPPD